MFIGGVHVIIGVMQRYKDHNEVLENGCRALGSFAVHGMFQLGMKCPSLDKECPSVPIL